MADKSPKKSSGKTVAAKTLKEKRADKKTKGITRAGNDITDSVNKKR
ncbi:MULTISPECIES: hypothetical protein [unclassified Salinibacterium]|nr:MULTISPECIES: hypothetical protein [unclassified Salinibacterium]